MGVKYEHRQLKTGLFARWQPIDFNVNSTSTVELNRGTVFVGWRGTIAEILGMDTFVESRAGINADSVTGNGVYISTQFGVPLGPPANSTDSKTELTFGGTVGVGLARTLTNGTRFEIKGFVGSQPVWQLTAHNGRPATLEHDNKLTSGVSGFLVIQTNPPDGPPRLPDLNLERRWREVR